MMLNKPNKGTDMIWRMLPKGSVGIEIGVWKGDSSEKFLRRAGFLHLVDAWSVDVFRGSDEHGGFKEYLSRYEEMVGSRNPADFQRYYDNIYAQVKERFADRPVQIHRCTSAEFFAYFKGRVDWAYIDGSHSYDGCLADLKAACKVTDCIYGDDYRGKPGVTRAVDNFVRTTRANFKRIGDQYRISGMKHEFA